MNTLSFNKALSILIMSLILSACDDNKVASKIQELLATEEVQAADPTLYDFQVHGCSLIYKGKALNFNQNIDTWMDVLGPADRNIKLFNRGYVWDQLGIEVLTPNDQNKPIDIKFRYSGMLSFSEENIENTYSESSKQSKREMNSARPKQPFNSIVWFNGAAISKVWNIAKVNQQLLAYNPETKTYFAEAYAPGVYATPVRCPLDQYPDYQNKEMIFRVDVEPHDGTATRMLTIGLNLNKKAQ